MPGHRKICSRGSGFTVSGVLGPMTGMLTYSNAGHNPPYLISPGPDVSGSNGDDASVVVRELPNTGPLLGLRMFVDITRE